MTDRARACDVTFMDKDYNIVPITTINDNGTASSNKKWLCRYYLWRKRHYKYKGMSGAFVKDFFHLPYKYRGLFCCGKHWQQWRIIHEC